MMSNFAKTTSALALALSASAAWGQAATVCNIPADPAPTITIAVASNFYEPAQALASSFTAAGAPGAGKVVRVCHNSTKLLVNEIKAGGAPYSLLLAANTAGPAEVKDAGKASELPFPYAYGVPVLWSASLSKDQLLSGDKINKENVTSLAIGNPSLAPYGAAAELILTDMQQWETPGGWISQYDNIALTKIAIQTGAQVAGFISKTQICPADTGGAYEEFTSYALQQDGVQIAGVDSTTTTVDFKTYLLSADVQNRLISEFCYVSSLSGNSNTRSVRRR